MKKINYLRLVRVVLAVVVSLSVTLLLLDFTGVLHPILGWSARIQFLPSLMALNFGVVVALLLITWLFGRIYCSVICPLGVLQDLLAHWSPKALKRKYNYSADLRAQGYCVNIDTVGRSIKAQMKYANKISSEFTVVIGDNELEADAAQLKCMADGTQTEVSLSEFCEGFERAYMNNAVSAFENADFANLTQVDINNLLR